MVLSMFIFFSRHFCPGHISGTVTRRLQIDCAAWSCGLILHYSLPSNLLRYFLLFFFLFFRHDFVRAISLEPLLAENPNSVCCLVLRSNFALLLTIQFALLISSLINIISLLLTTFDWTKVREIAPRSHTGRPRTCLVIFLVGCLFVSRRFLRGWLPVVALSRLRGGVQLFCFPVAPSQSVLPALSGALGGLPGSLLCLPPGYGSSCFHGSLWFGLVLQLPSMRALRLASLRPLGGSTVSYLGSRRYGLSSTLVFSVTLQVGSSWAPPSSFSWSRAFLQTGVVSLLNGPALGVLLGASSSSPLAAWPLCLFLGGFSRPSVCYGVSLLFFWTSYPSVSSLCQSGADF